MAVSRGRAAQLLGPVGGNDKRIVGVKIVWYITAITPIGILVLFVVVVVGVILGLSNWCL